jgi:hypothetical protein
MGAMASAYFIILAISFFKAWGWGWLRRFTKKAVERELEP